MFRDFYLLSFLSDFREREKERHEQRGTGYTQWQMSSWTLRVTHQQMYTATSNVWKLHEKVYFSSLSARISSHFKFLDFYLKWFFLCTFATDVTIFKNLSQCSFTFLLNMWSLLRSLLSESIFHCFRERVYTSYRHKLIARFWLLSFCLFAWFLHLEMREKF